MTILFDIIYIIMMTTTLSIIGLCSAGLTLAVTLYIVDKLLLRFVISNISDELLPPPPPPPPPTSPPGLVVTKTPLPPPPTTTNTRRRFIFPTINVDLLLDLLVTYCGPIFLYFMFTFVYYYIGDENVGTTIIITINIAMMAVYVLSSRSASPSPSLIPSILPCDEQQRRSTTTSTHHHQSSRMMIINNILLENLFIIMLKPTFLISYFALSFMKISIVMVLLQMECSTTMRYRSTTTSMHVLLSSSWLISSFALLLSVNNFLMMMNFVIMLTSYD